MVSKFSLYHVNAGQTIANVEMDEDLLKPEADIISESLTIKGVPHGEEYTLIPIDDHKVSVINRIKNIHSTITTKPISMPSAIFGKLDELVDAVGMLFSEIKYFIIKDKSDFDKLINKHANEHKKPEEVSYKVIDELMKE